MLNIRPKKQKTKEKNRKQFLLFFIASMSMMSLQAQCPAVNVPYTENFESAVVPGMPACTSLETTGATNRPWKTNAEATGGFTGTFIKCISHPWIANNSWFFTRGINLVANTTYTISYDYGSSDAGQGTQSLKLACGTTASEAGMTFPLADHPEITSGLTANLVSFTPVTSGVYYFGFNAYTVPAQYSLNLDNIAVNVYVPVPPVITNFTSSTNCGQTTVLTINGTNLLNATVKIGGTPITLTTNTASQIRATILTAMSGPVVVTTNGGTATSTSNFTFMFAPTLTLSGITSTICAGTASNPVTIATGASGYTAYSWTPSTGVTGNSTSGWVFNPAANTSYVLNASNPATGCTKNLIHTIEVMALPSQVTVTPSSIEICQNAASAVATAGASGPSVDGADTISFGLSIQVNAGEDNTDGDFVPGTLNLNEMVDLPAGAVITAAKLVFSEVYVGWTGRAADLEASLSGAMTMAPTRITENLSALNGGTYELDVNDFSGEGNVSLALANHSEGDANYGSIKLVIEYMVPEGVDFTWWNASTGGTQIGTGATLEIVGTSVLPATATPGIYTVYVQASNGACAGTSRTAVTVTVKANPAPVITVPSSLTMCEGNNLVLTSSAPSGNVWSTNATTNSITVTTGGSYTVTVTQNGCGATSAPVVVTVTPKPVAAASLTGNVTITATPAGQTYQWINCTTNAPVSGATGVTFTTPVNGSYKVIVTNAGGCKDTSTCVNVSKVGLDENNMDIGVSLYPNPIEGNVYLNMTETEKADVTVLDALGKVVLTMNNIQDGTVIDMNHTEKGIYLVKVSNTRGTNVFRMVKK